MGMLPWLLRDNDDKLWRHAADTRRFLLFAVAIVFIGRGYREMALAFFSRLHAAARCIHMLPTPRHAH